MSMKICAFDLLRGGVILLSINSTAAMRTKIIVLAKLVAYRTYFHIKFIPLYTQLYELTQ